MKNRSAAIFTVFFGILLLLGSCADLFKPPVEPGPAAGKLRLSILLEDAPRTAMPQGGFDKYVLRFHYEGEGGYTHGDLEGTSGFSVDLEPGPWTIYADAYASGVVSGTGSAAVTVGAGLTGPVSIRIEAMKTGTGTPGTLRYTMNYPAAGLNHAYGSQTLTVIDISNGTVVRSVPLANGVPGDIELDPGVYLVTAIINDTAQRTQARRTASAHIYAGRETVLTISIGEEEFTAAIPLTGTAGLGGAGGLETGSRVIRAYADYECATFLGGSGELDGGGSFILWIPSKNDGTVYLRQEITVNGVTTAGTVRPVIIAENQDGPPLINWEEGGGDVLYALTVEGGINGGTVSANLEAAFPGTGITLTVSPDAGYQLKAGSLQYNDGASDYPISGTGFTMPQADVRVTGAFTREFGVNFSGPKDEAITLTPEHSAGGSSTSIAYGTNHSLTVTATEGFSAYTWYVDGKAVQNGPARSVTLHARDFLPRRYTLTLLAKKGSMEYSAKLVFTVSAKLTDITEIGVYLAEAAGGDTPDTALPLPVGIALEGSGWAALLAAIAAADRYVALDLAGSSVPALPAPTGKGGDFDPRAGSSAGKAKIVSLTLPDDAASLGFYSQSNSFTNFSALREVSGANIVYVSHDVLKGRTTLIAIDFPALENIGSSTFEGCTSLTEVDLPNLTGFDHQSFKNCTSLRVVRLEKVTNSGGRSQVFSGCTSLEEAYLPAATTIGSGFFTDCNLLTTVALGGNCNVSGSGIPNNFETYYSSGAKAAGVYKYYSGAWHYEGPYTE